MDELERILYMQIFWNHIWNEPNGNRRLLLNNDQHYNIIKETYVVIIQMDITMEPTNFEIVLKELQTPITVLEKIWPIEPPYQTDASLTRKVQTTYQTLLRSTRMRNRILSLVNAFYLGQLIDDVTISPAQRTLQMSTITKHYYRTAIRVYHLFENIGVQRIFDTQCLTLTIVRRLKSSEYQALVLETLNISAGAEILSGE